MFQDTLLIIKPDYLAKRKTLLLYLLQQGFFIKGQRKICFTPELAAEFYQDLAEDRCFMFQVILLSKGNSEAFILAKECAVKNLINDMVCYFNTSTEMEQNIHVTKCLGKVQREISFIFPNYIHEPIYRFEQFKFCANNPLVESTIKTLYDIVTNPSRDPHKSWKEKLAESLILTNQTLPQMSNQCCHNLSLNVQDIAQQTEITCFKHEQGETRCFPSDVDISKDYSSLNVTTSSCASCSVFDSDADCMKQTFVQPYTEIIKARTAPLSVLEPVSSSTVKTERECALEEWIMEEHVVGEDCKEEADKVDSVTNDREENKVIEALKITVTEHMEDKEIPQTESLQSTAIIDDTSVKLEENAVHGADIDNNKLIEEDVVQSPDDYVAEDKKSVEEIEEDVFPSTA